jgi:hypothetical protein
MTEAVAAPQRREALLTSPWTAFSWLAAVAALLYCGYFAGTFAKSTQEELRFIPYLPYDERVDFAYFYAGASMAWHGDAADLYPHPGEITWYPTDPVFDLTTDEYANARLLARGNYYNPPALAYVHSPLTTLGFRTAYWTFTALSAAALGLFIYIFWRAEKRIPEFPLLVLGIVSFRPVHEALIMGHSALLFCLALGAGFLLLRARKEVLCGLCFSLLAVKPQWAILPGLFLLARWQWKALLTMGAASAVIFFIPFLITGFGTLENYVAFLRFQSALDLKDAPHMFSWNGFLFKLRGGPLYGVDPPPAVWTYALVALTAVPLAVVWWGRNYLLGVAATIVAMLLISTHSVWYDWAILIVAAAFLLLWSAGQTRAVRVQTWAVLLACHIAAAQSIGVLLAPDRYAIDWHSSGFFSLTPVAFAALVWMAAQTILAREVRLADFRRSPRSLRPRAAGS